ncbi:ULP PROTEASE domain-containing protein [Citrus sinensis]|nr:ULP PROTEASE domain-containing protein [Citrus sinensis]
MGKRKRGDANNPIDIVSSTPEDPGHLSKHRTCWLHTVAFLHARKMKISKQKIRNFELTAPCFLGTFSCRRRSKRRVKCKNTSLIKGKNSSSVKCKDMITKRRKNKLDSGKFEHLLDNLWRSFSEDKKAGFTYLDSLWFVMDIYKAEERPETKELISRIPLLVPKVPQQRNGEECGNFVLYFINLFVEGAPENFNLEDYPYFMEKNWFTAEDLDCFCERLNSSEN